MTASPGSPPNYNGSSALEGRLPRQRHEAVLEIQPAAGDYGVQGSAESDIDVLTGNARSYAKAVVLVNAAGVVVNPGSNYNGTPLGYQQIAAATLQAATALTVPAGATFAVIEPEAGNVRWRDDGPNPTTAVGVPVLVGQQLVYASVAGLAAIKFIDQDANGILNVSYYK